MNNIIEKAAGQAYIHCEMLFLMYFSQSNAKEYLDYFDYSKKYY